MVTFNMARDGLHSYTANRVLALIGILGVLDQTAMLWTS